MQTFLLISANFSCGFMLDLPLRRKKAFGSSFSRRLFRIQPADPAHQICQFLVFTDNIGVVLSSVRKHTPRTVLSSGGQDSEVPAASVAQCIQRAVTEKTVEVLWIRSRMARKIFAFRVTEIGIFFLFPIFRHTSPTIARFRSDLIMPEPASSQNKEGRCCFGVEYAPFMIYAEGTGIRSSIACHLIMYNS